MLPPILRRIADWDIKFQLVCLALMALAGAIWLLLGR